MDIPQDMVRTDDFIRDTLNKHVSTHDSLLSEAQRQSFRSTVINPVLKLVEIQEKIDPKQYTASAEELRLLVRGRI